MQTVPALFVDRCRRTPDQIAFEAPDPTAPGGWRSWTWQEALLQGSGLVRRLHALGVDHGVPVAIVAQTRQEWAAVDIATLALGGITVGIYPTLRPEQIAWQVEHSRAEVVVLEDAAMVAALEPVLSELEHVRHIRAIDADTGVPQLTPAEDDVPFLEERVAKVALEQVATIVYTSGTTGLPKGAVLTHGNFAHVIEASRQALPTKPGDRSVIFLPLAHSLQRVTLYRGLAEEAVGTYAPSIDALPETLVHARPHVLATVPRMLEKIRAKAEAEAEKKNPRARQILDQAVRVGVEVQKRKKAGQPVPLHLRALHAGAERLVFRKVRQRLGGELRLLISGGAALDPALADWFEAMGIMVREGWGLTETSAPATLNTELAWRVGTVGRPLPGVEVKVADDGELLVRGPGNFKEYFRNPEATAAAIDAEGWFHTGDLGAISADGYVKITGRKKEIIVTAGGKNVAPVPLELALEGSIIDQAVVIGSERPYLVALISLDEELVAAAAKAKGWPGELAQWREHPELHAMIEARVAALNEDVNRWETIKRWSLLPEPLSVEAGELTATLKKKRAAIEERHAHRIEELYARAR